MTSVWHHPGYSLKAPEKATDDIMQSFPQSVETVEVGAERLFNLKASVTNVGQIDLI